MPVADWKRPDLIDPDPEPRRKKKPPVRALECLTCERRFSADDIARGNYNLETMICSFCYAERQRAAHSVSCFGKPTVVLLDGKRLYGYNVLAGDCARRCPDRVICRRIVLPDEPV